VADAIGLPAPSPALREADRLDELLATLPGEHASAQRRELAVARGELTEIARGLYLQALARTR
jgi:hypothetical protein